MRTAKVMMIGGRPGRILRAPASGTGRHSRQVCHGDTMTSRTLLFVAVNARWSAGPSPPSGARRERKTGRGRRGSAKPYARTPTE